MIAVAGVATMASADTLSTTLPNNGSGGVFMTLTPTTAVNVTSFDTYLSNTAANQIEVWVRAGAYAGFTTSNAGWTLYETVNTTGAGTTTLAPVPLTTALSVTGETSVYLHSITSGGGIRYTGTNANPPVMTWSNADLTLFSNITHTGAVPFGGSEFTPRTFAGNVNYTVVPAPGAMALLGMGGLVATRRRRG